MITGISHITFIVKDLEKSSGFFREIFGAREVYSSSEKKFSLSSEKFFLINEVWICIMEGEPLKEKTYNHTAFKILEKDFDLYKSKIINSGVEILPERIRIEGEGRSIYFYDFDNHLFELHTGTLYERLEHYKKH